MKVAVTAPILKPPPLGRFQRIRAPLQGVITVRFSEAELRQAFEKGGLDSADAGQLVRVILEVQEQGDDFILTDETLLMLAAVSDDAAHRVLQMNPALSEMVARLRRNPDSMGELLAELRAARPE